jgi:hypothetical protein
MTLYRIQALENLGFEWKSSISLWRETRKEPSVDDVAMLVSESVMEKPEHIQQHSLKMISN